MAEFIIPPPPPAPFKKPNVEYLVWYKEAMRVWSEAMLKYVDRVGGTAADRAGDSALRAFKERFPEPAKEI